MSFITLYEYASLGHRVGPSQMCHTFPKSITSWHVFCLLYENASFNQVKIAVVTTNVTDSNGGYMVLDSDHRRLQIIRAKEVLWKHYILAERLTRQVWLPIFFGYEDTDTHVNAYRSISPFSARLQNLSFIYRLSLK